MSAQKAMSYLRIALAQDMMKRAWASRFLGLDNVVGVTFTPGYNEEL